MRPLTSPSRRSCEPCLRPAPPSRTAPPTDRALPLSPSPDPSGRVLHGRSVVRLIEESPVQGDSPTESVLIRACGELSPDDDGLAADPFADGHEDYPSDDESDVNNPKVALAVAGEIKEKGTQLFKEGNFDQASRKWQKSLRCAFTLSLSLSHFYSARA